MHLTSVTALSAFALASVGSVQAAHDVNLVQRGASGHRAALARAASKRAVSVPSTLQKRSSKEKRCRLRSTSTFVSTVVVPTGTATSNPDASATIDGAADDLHHHTRSSSAGGGQASQTATATYTAPSATGTYSSSWSLAQTRQGNNFFDNWTFWNYDDPTHGTVEFVDSATAWSESLVAVTNGQAFMRANTDPNVGNRKSIRITDNYTFNIGTLIVMDAAHMPTGCGTWPAWWANGPDWPNGGEIDIVEGVNNQAQNQATLHTSEGCTASTDGSTASTGQLTNANCGSSDTDNSGCGFTDTTNDNSFGTGFNNAGGGVYVMRWDQSGITVWFFTRTAIPDDINADQPMPDSWPAPFAHWAADTCNPGQYFNNNNAIFDLTFCGDWAGSAGSWSSSGCADSTGYSSCSDYVSAVGSGFTDAYWAINYVKYFTSS